MRMSEVFERAAELVANGTELAACPAIIVAASGSADAPRKFFAELFQPPRRASYEAWFGDVLAKENRHPRVIALLFAAAIARSEGL